MYLEYNIDDKIKLFEENLLSTNRGFNFYVDWSNTDDYKKYKVELCALDALIGCNDEFDELFLDLLTKMPSVITTFPFLFALSKKERDNVISGKEKLKVVGTEIDSEDLQEYSFFYDYKNPTPLTDTQKYEYLDFFVQMGLKDLFQSIMEKSVIDYVVGVLVGLDSNGRKNRGGKAFELACEPIISEICSKYGVEVITQKKFVVLEEKGFNISKDIANRKADFILLKADKCLNIEVNFFNDAGSKPEEIIDSYINRQSDLSNNGIEFALITDGRCWDGTTNQLNKGFRHLNYLMNYKMAKLGLLEEIINNIFGE